MKFEIIKQKENPLLKRREIAAAIEFDASTPQKKDIIARLCAEQNVKEECVVLDTFKQEYGTKQGVAYLKVYEDKESKELVENVPNKEGEGKPKEAAEAEPKPADEVKKEAPAEEKKEEPAEAPKEEVKEEKPEEKREGEQ